MLNCRKHQTVLFDASTAIAYDISVVEVAGREVFRYAWHLGQQRGRWAASRKSLQGEKQVLDSSSSDKMSQGDLGVALCLQRRTQELFMPSFPRSPACSAPETTVACIMSVSRTIARVRTQFAYFDAPFSIYAWDCVPQATSGLPHARL